VTPVSRNDERRCDSSARQVAAGTIPIWDDCGVADLDVEIQAHPGQAILVLHGELDLETKAQLQDEAIEQLGVPGLATLGLDLADITFLDSSGVSVLVELRNQAQERGIDVEIVAVSRRVARVLTIVGLAKSFGIPPDPEAVPAQ
jgi:anti-sigma B factor antagonist